MRWRVHLRHYTVNAAIRHESIICVETPLRRQEAQSRLRYSQRLIIDEWVQCENDKTISLS